MCRKIVIFIISGIFGCYTYAQKTVVSGYVSDSVTGEKLIGASIFILQNESGTVTNNFGFFSVSCSPSDTITLIASYIGYSQQTKITTGRKNQQLNFKLSPYAYELKGFEVTSRKRIEEETQMSVLELPLQQIETLPKFMGETDVLKTFQLMPGVQGGNEGNNALYVRGGSPDQNLILLDDVPLYYTSHLGGFVSVFDASVINNVKLIKGGFPARYGGRLSSVIDIRMKDGNQKKLSGDFTLGTLVSKLSLEGPIGKKTTFLISARRSFLDLFTRLFQMNSDSYKAWYYLYDVNAKVCHRINDRNKLFLSFYKGSDNLTMKAKYYTYYDNGESGTIHENAGIGWGNTMASLRWNHIYNDKLFGNISLSYTNFQYKNYVKDKGEAVDEKYIFSSGIKDLNLKADFDYFLSDKHSVKFGACGIFHFFNPGMSKYNGSVNIQKIDNPQFQSGEAYLFAEDEIRFSKKISANIGLHASSYFVQNASFFSLQPRISMNYGFAEFYALKLSFVTMQQNLHLLSNSNAGFPADLWVPSTQQILPESSKQLAVGIVRSINPQKLNIEISLEAYYKTLNNLIEFKEGTSYFSVGSWESKVAQNGTGKVYGIELLLHKKTGDLNGWIGYTYARNIRQFDNLNNGNPFPYRFDRPHDFSIVLNYKLNKKVSLSCSWVYSSGSAVTLATEKSDLYVYGNLYGNGNGNGVGNGDGLLLREEAHIYGERNSYRMPSFHKLDIGINFTKELEHGTRTWNISIYNVYNRQNPFLLYFKTDNQQLKLYQVSIFPIIPSFSYSYKFK